METMTQSVEVRKFIICRGIQGSGKTTFAKQWAKENPTKNIRINNDDIRNMLGSYWVPVRENLVSCIVATTLTYAMNSGYNIVVDNMNLNVKTCLELERAVEDFNTNFNYDWIYKIEYRDFFIPLEECIKRDALRPNPIGEKVIRDTYNKYKNILEKQIN